MIFFIYFKICDLNFFNGKFDNKRYSETLTFRSSIEANQFVDDWASKKKKFLDNHNKMPDPCTHFFHPNQFIAFVS
jgi:hypothetical protein